MQLRNRGELRLQDRRAAGRLDNSGAQLPDKEEDPTAEAAVTQEPRAVSQEEGQKKWDHHIVGAGWKEQVP